MTRGLPPSLFPFSLFFFLLPWKIDRSPESIDLHRGSSSSVRSGSHVEATKLESSRWLLRTLYLDPAQQPFNSHFSSPLLFIFPSIHLHFNPGCTYFFIDRSIVKKWRLFSFLFLFLEERRIDRYLFTFDFFQNIANFVKIETKFFTCNEI